MSKTPIEVWIEKWGTNLDWEAKAKLREAVQETINTDYSLLIQAKKENRLVILPSKSEEIIRVVEFALKIKLCLSDGDPIDLTKQSEVARYADGSHGSSYYDWFRSYLRDIYYELQRIGGLKLRKINFTKPSLKER